ncbi:hypothetical protein WICANDRAFT_105852 [Wickerhamomyces anomalus NRRL Y-366-8]|uniref:Mid2 domain-containing protein n=1 Tax=Wickerhamomyces anomalus (strain ATCC 58044 / CBS 1984 / NCYC 433 / NRRL Y-366-8) TaxID=683960 RepID=A0A1E3P1E5_WICAA|nr:uncharacterized protein WICANDRAFT_105852 [Wickerhamomyces anomalus NRRL Y-366-8]ODQ59014.1 hypothetical protein WICANDRAFT_105852 [Wickerhamomyces anomalus NRRL Y-366-8]
MKYFKHFVLATLPSLIATAALPQANPEVTNAPLVKRGQSVLSDQVWTSSSDGIIMAITPTVIDAVTISASPVTGKPTVWASLDNSGIPSLVTPTVKDGKTISESPTPTDTGFPTPAAVPPVLRCFGNRVPDSNSDTPGYPFCTALNGTEMLVGETYWLTWDPTYWGSTDITRVKIELIEYPQPRSGGVLFETQYLSNADGYYPLTMDSSFIKNDGYFWVTITPLTTSTTNAKNIGTKNGPLLRVIRTKADALTKINRLPSDNGLTTSKSQSDSKAKTIAPAVVVPVIVVIGIAIFVIWYLTKQKKSALLGLGNLRSTKNKNTASSSSQAQGDIHLSPATTHADNETIATTITNETTKNPFTDTRQVL